MAGTAMPDTDPPLELGSIGGGVPCAAAPTRIWPRALTFGL